MGEKRFLTNVAEKALFRTQRETASVNWSRLEEDVGFSFRDMAEYILNVDPYDHNTVIHSFPLIQRRKPEVSESFPTNP